MASVHALKRYEESDSLWRLGIGFTPPSEIIGVNIFVSVAEAYDCTLILTHPALL